MNEKTVERKLLKNLKKLNAYDEKSVRVFFDNNKNYKVDGNSLFHLCLKLNKGSYSVNNLINSFIALGLNPNILDKNGRTFLQVAVEYNKIDTLVDFLYYLDDKYAEKINFENYDKEGNNLFTSLIKNEILIPNLYSSGLSTKFKHVIKNIINFSSQDIIFNANKDNILKESRNSVEAYINSKYKIFDTDVMHAAYLAYNQVQSMYYQKNISLVNKELTSMVNYNKEIVSKMFCTELETKEDYNKFDPIYCCIENCELNDDNLKALERYLNMGFTLHLSFKNYNYFELAIDHGCTTQYFCSLVTLFNKYGFNINDAFNCRWERIFKKMDSVWKIEDIVKIYTFLCQHKCDHLKRTMIDREYYNNIRILGFIKLLTDKLNNNNLKIDNDLLKDKNKIEDFFEILDAYYHLLGCVNDYEITNLVIEKILDERQNQTNNTDTIVTEKEVLSALQKVTIDINNNKFNKILLKTK